MSSQVFLGWMIFKNFSLIWLDTQCWLAHRVAWVSTWTDSCFPRRKVPSSKVEIVTGIASVIWDHEQDTISVPYSVGNKEEPWYRAWRTMKESEFRKWGFLTIILGCSCHTDQTYLKYLVSSFTVPFMSQTPICDLLLVALSDCVSFQN